MKDVVHFEPNVETHKEFGDTLKYAKENGVNIVAVDCLVDEDSINIRDYVDVIL